MIRSMTGYGGAKGVVEGLNVTVELKSVNNRYLDIAVRMPRNFLFAEDAVKSTIQQHVSRGKLDVFVTIDSSQAADTVLRVNEPLLRAYIDTLNTLAVRYDLKNDMSLMSLMRFPDILSGEKAEADQDKIRAASDKIELVLDTVVTGLMGEDSLQGLHLKNVKTGEETQLPVDGMFVFVGYEPQNSFLPVGLELDPQGFIITDCEMRTNLPGLFAAGDIRSKMCRQVTTAVGDGATAATAAFTYLEQLDA